MIIDITFNEKWKGVREIHFRDAEYIIQIPVTLPDMPKREDRDFVVTRPNEKAMFYPTRFIREVKLRELPQ